MDVIEKLILVAVVWGISLVAAMYSTYFERKFASFFQDRVGPDRAGPWGLLQPAADGLKLFTKEEFTPEHANKFLFILGPALAMLTACMTSAVLPWTHPMSLDNGEVRNFFVADINIGLLYIFGVVSLGVYGVMIGGWASNNKYSLLSAIRAASQNISYEIAMGLSVIALIMVTGTLSVNEMVVQQGDAVLGISGARWNVLVQPLGFIIFLICAFAETNRTPFDLPECEAELIGGYHTEYSSMKMGFYLFAEYINMFISSAVMAALYFGGYNFPGQEAISNPMLLSTAWRLGVLG